MVDSFWTRTVHPTSVRLFKRRCGTSKLLPGAMGHGYRVWGPNNVLKA